MGKKYKIGAAATLSGTTIRTVRYYEEQGLLEPKKSRGGTRYYTKKHLARLRIILELAKIGLPLATIRKMAEIRTESKTGAISSLNVNYYLSEVLAQIKTKLDELDKLQKEIVAALSTIAKCKGCNNYPSSGTCPECPVNAKLSENDLLNLLWDTE